MTTTPQDTGLTVAVTGPTGTFGLALMPLLQADDRVDRMTLRAGIAAVLDERQCGVGRTEDMIPVQVDGRIEQLWPGGHRAGPMCRRRTVRPKRRGLRCMNPRTASMRKEKRPWRA